LSNFKHQYQQIDPQLRAVYDHTYNRVLPKIPFRNHKLTQEQAHVCAWMNIVMETYSSDTTIALSEKIFRALCLPVPWIVYSGKHTVAYLHSLGFDVMQDVVEHKYDSMIENKTANHGDKMVVFLYEGVEAVERMQAEQPSQRAEQAARINRQRLQDMKAAWPADFAAWWPTVVERIK
jgi:hypothetical protein